MPTLISPGSAGAADVTVAASRLRRRHLGSRSALTSGHVQVFRPLGTSVGFDIQIIGINVVREHFLAVAEATIDLSAQAVNTFGGLVTTYARDHAPFQDQTGDTRASIHHTMITSRDDIGVDVGPTTFYSPFLEYGTSKMHPYPFMIPALDAMTGPFTDTMYQIARIADQWLTFSGPAGSALNAAIQDWRRYLYSTQKALGDIQQFGGFPGVAGTRSLLLSTARALGDVQAVVGGTVSLRASRRVRGRATGRLIGVGARTVSVDKTYSGFAGGTAGHRIYNRIAGRVVSGGVYSGINRKIGTIS
jgi:HK97 gp10 family phage protein